MNYNTILYDKSQGLARITLNRPDVLNAMNGSMERELDAVITNVGQDAEVRAVLITGSGRGFCAGGDLKAIQALEGAVPAREFVYNFNQTIKKLLYLEKPVITAVNGLAVGAGCNLALAGDIIIAAESAQFSEIFVNVGLIPDCGGTYLLARSVGVARAKKLILTGEKIGAVEAERIGMVSQVVPDVEFQQVVEETARRLAEGPTKALGLAKVILNKNLGLEEALEYEAYGNGLLIQSEDHKEAVNAFFGKRKPNFQGR